MEKQQISNSPTHPSCLLDMCVSFLLPSHVRGTRCYSEWGCLGHTTVTPFRNRVAGVRYLLYSYSVVTVCVWGWIWHLLVSFLFFLGFFFSFC